MGYQHASIVLTARLEKVGVLLQLQTFDSLSVSL